MFDQDLFFELNFAIIEYGDDCMILIELRSEDDEPLFVQAREGENLLRALKRAGVALWAPCGGEGSCGRCRVKLISGTLESLPSFYISDEDYREGWRLACLSRLTENVILYIEG